MAYLLRVRVVGKEVKQLVRNGEAPYALKAGREENADFYMKWAQAIASSHAWVKEVAQRFETNASSGKNNSFVFLPFLVVPENCLWTVDFDDHTGKSRKPTQATHAHLFVGRYVNATEDIVDERPRHYLISHMHVVTPKGLRDWFSTLEGAENHNHPTGIWDDLFRGDVRN